MAIIGHIHMVVSSGGRGLIEIASVTVFSIETNHNKS